MTQEQKNNPLHGVKLEALLKELVDHYGWQSLGQKINLNCFKNNPSIKSSLKFLRRTEWAREKVERFYLYDFKRLPKARDDQYEIPPRKRIISTPKSQTAKSSIHTNASASRTKEENVKKSANKFNPWTADKLIKK